ncbi:MAG: CHAD domain-containing protein [Bacteroidia bacterium]
MNLYEKLSLYVRENVNSVKQLLRSSGSLTPEGYHKLRVEIKKLHAFFKMVRYLNRTFKQKHIFKPLRSVFSDAGKIRELKVQGKLLDKYAGKNKLKDYRIHLKNSELRLKENFQNNLGLQVKKNIRSIPKLIQPYLITIHSADISDYLKKENKKIRKLAGDEKHSARQLHEIRKLIKEVFYNQKITGTPGVTGPAEEKLHKLIGKWHDLAVMKKLLSKSAKNAIKERSSPGKLKEISKTVASDRKALRGKITKRLLKFNT